MATVMITPLKPFKLWFKWDRNVGTVQLTAKFTLACAIHACVVQFYLSDLSELACHTRVRLLMLHSSQS